MPGEGSNPILSWEREIVVGLWRENPGFALVDAPWSKARVIAEKLARMGGVRDAVARQAGNLGRRTPITIKLRNGWRVVLFRAERRDQGVGDEPFIICPDASLAQAVVFDGRDEAHAAARTLGRQEQWAWFGARRYRGTPWLDQSGIAWDSYLEEVLDRARGHDPFRVRDRRTQDIVVRRQERATTTPRGPKG